MCTNKLTKCLHTDMRKQLGDKLAMHDRDIHTYVHKLRFVFSANKHVQDRACEDRAHLHS